MKLTLGREIGSGAIGRVVEVVDDQGTIVYAGKILHESHGHDPVARSRFAAEAELLLHVEHENVVRVSGIESIAGHDVLLMERIVGDSLAAISARSSPLPASRIIEIGRGLAAGLAAAHHAGLIHRDLKPANVLVTAKGRPKLVDFGLARASSLARADGASLAVVGTPAYMAPESVDPMAVDARADLYSLGCILFELGLGRPPFAAPTPVAMLECHRSAAIPELPSHLGDALVALVHRLLAKSPADRPQSASVVAAELERMTDSGTKALILAPSHEGRCAGCGDVLVEHVDICFGCGVPLPSMAAGDWTVYAIGPGEHAGKIDTSMRERLLDWLRDNPSLGLEPTALANTVPRLPFVIATRVSEASARALTGSLTQLGFEAEAQRGGVYSYAPLRKTAWKLTARTGAIVGTTMVYMANSLKWVVLPMIAIAAVGSVVSGWRRAGRRLIKQGEARPLLPASLETSIDRVEGVVPAMDARRHRQNLRAVVQRVLALREFFQRWKLEGADAELAAILDLAVIASSRIDELESGIDRQQLDANAPGTRERLRERDMWAARLMETTANLEALRARFVAGVVGVDEASSAEQIDELRAQVEALREVEKL